MPRNSGKPSRETIAKIAKRIDAAKEYVDSLSPDERAAEISRLARQAANTAKDPDISDAELLAELDDPGEGS